MAKSQCYQCRRTLPRDRLVRQQVLKGHQGRIRNGYVLMCSDCSSKVRSNNATVAIISLIGMAVLAAVVVAIRGY